MEWILILCPKMEWLLIYPTLCPKMGATLYWGMRSWAIRFCATEYNLFLLELFHISWNLHLYIPENYLRNDLAFLDLDVQYFYIAQHPEPNGAGSWLFLFIYFFFFFVSLSNHWKFLRIPDSYGAKIAKICNFCAFWPIIQLIHYKLECPEVVVQAYIHDSYARELRSVWSPFQQVHHVSCSEWWGPRSSWIHRGLACHRTIQTERTSRAYTPPLWD